jgi:hypothetical protein
MSDFAYSKNTNAFYLSYKYSAAFYGFLIDPLNSALKCYQDLLVLSFIENNLPLGAKLLDVGGGYSRVLRHLKHHYECWCIDKYEGIGSGSATIPTDAGYRVVVDYMGNFNAELPDKYFDLVFSISALEHSPQGAISTSLIIDDINRVLGETGFSLHCLDMAIDRKTKKGISVDRIGLFDVQRDFLTVASNPLPPLEDILSDPNLFVLPETIFQQWNLPYSYDDLCIIDRCIFWQNERYG